MMLHQTWDTPAFRHLSPGARWAYLEFKRALGADVEGRNGRLGMSVRRLAELCDVSAKTAQAYMAALEANGFIVATQRGALGVEGVGKATEWRLTELGTAANRIPTKDYVARGGPGAKVAG